MPRMAEKSHPEAPAEGSTQANKALGKAIYEVGFHLVPEIAENELGTQVERMNAAIASAGGTIVAQEPPKRKTLTYRIERSVQGKREKYTESWFGWMKFDGDAEELRAGLPALQEKLRHMHEIMRYLVVATVYETPAPQRAVFSSDRLMGEAIEKKIVVEDKKVQVSEEELEKSIEALVQ